MVCHETKDCESVSLTGTTVDSVSPWLTPPETLSMIVRVLACQAQMETACHIG